MTLIAADDNGVGGLRVRLNAVDDAIDRLSHDRVRHTHLIHDLEAVREELSAAIKVATASGAAEEREAC